MDVHASQRRLQDRITELRAAIDQAADYRKPVELDQVVVGRLSRMDAMQRQAMAEATMRQHAREIARAQAALKRMEAGEFGYCVACGGDIAVRRLENDPAVATCIECAA